MGGWSASSAPTTATSPKARQAYAAVGETEEACSSAKPTPIPVRSPSTPLRKSPCIIFTLARHACLLPAQVAISIVLTVRTMTSHKRLHIRWSEATCRQKEWWKSVSTKAALASLTPIPSHSHI